MLFPSLTRLAKDTKSRALLMRHKQISFEEICYPSDLVLRVCSHLFMVWNGRLPYLSIESSTKQYGAFFRNLGRVKEC